MIEKRWISVQETSQYLSLHPKSIYDLIYKGKIPAARVGGSVRVDRKKLDELMENSEIGTNLRDKTKKWRL